jgi:beta-lactamase superfamily II metal-dependent hydrolase
MMRRGILVLLVLYPLVALAQANGKLQLHFIDVGQGDGALLISPGGQTVLFDNGDFKECSKPVAYLDQLGVAKIDYHIASHYHADHIGCTQDVLASAPLVTAAYDRGGSYDSSSYENYIAAVGAKRATATKGMTFTLDSATASPVTITIVGVDGNGIDTDNENDRSVVAKVNMGTFDAVIGGDLSGVETDDYLDIETGLAPDVGQVEVYKVHHHGSRYSSNEDWLATIHPRVGIISTGTKNKYGHPTQECLDRLHDAGIKTYWTSRGKGATPDEDQDTIAGTVIVEYTPGTGSFTVTGTKENTALVTFDTWEGAPTITTASTTTFVWSKASRTKVFHYPSCVWADQISAKNRQAGTTPPAGWHLHTGCPTTE